MGSSPQPRKHTGRRTSAASNHSRGSPCCASPRGTLPLLPPRCRGWARAQSPSSVRGSCPPTSRLCSAGDLEAHGACVELDMCALYESAVLGAICAQARGAVALAQDDSHGAHLALREAGVAGAEAPYEAAACACSLGWPAARWATRTQPRWSWRQLRVSLAAGSRTGSRPGQLADRGAASVGDHTDAA